MKIRSWLFIVFVLPVLALSAFQAGIVQAEPVVVSQNQVFLPVVMLQIAPSAPALNPITAADIGFYAVTWTPVAGAASYALQQSADPNFTNPVTVYAGPATAWYASNMGEGTYYYRVNAIVNGAPTDWSNAQSTYIQPLPAGVTILNNSTTYKTFPESMFLYVFGEVYNNTPDWLSTVTVAVDFYNGSALVATSSTGISIHNLGPHEKSPFQILLEDPGPFTSYAFEPIYYKVGTQTRPDLLVSEASLVISSATSARILGVVTNNSSSNVQYASGVATAYDEDGLVLFVGSSYVNIADLAPGQSSAFQVSFSLSDTSKIKSFRVQPDTGW